MAPEERSRTAFHEPEAKPCPTELPGHIAIIMDGNGRWATQRNLPRIAGHQAGVEAVRAVVETCFELGVRHLTLFAFSTENWKRPQDEVDALMDLLVKHIRKELPDLQEKGVQIRTIGRIEDLPAYARDEMAAAVEATENNQKLTLTLALNYGARREITDAARELARLVLEGRIDLEAIDEGAFAARLYTAGLPDPDLIIRPGGEKRMSNFLLWQGAYAEFWTTDVCWPDFRREHLLEAIENYRMRERRFGGL